MASPRVIEIKEALLSEDRSYAESLRSALAAEGCLVVNVMGSPGCGKTSLILATLRSLPRELEAAVVEADLDSTVDSEAVEAAGYPAVQLHTGGFCHLDARMTAAGLGALGLGPDARAGSGAPPPQGDTPISHNASQAAAPQKRAPAGAPQPSDDTKISHNASHANVPLANTPQAKSPQAESRPKPRLVLVENVGNLVCTAQVDAGAHLDVALLSLPEGDDKPLKYPIMFREADIVIITKIDFAAVQEFDIPAFRERVRFLNPGAPILALSAKTGEGLGGWIDVLLERRRLLAPGG